MSRVYLSARAIAPLQDYIETAGMNIHLVDGQGSKVDPRIATHADLYMCQLGLGEDSVIFMGDGTKPSAPYPGDAIYNACCNDSVFLHKLDITDPRLLDFAKARALTPIHVKQGYARCSCIPVRGGFITADGGIYKSLLAAGIDCLLVSPGHVELNGFPYGFIGGACGNILIYGQEALIFNGDLMAHPDGQEIIDFAIAHDTQVIHFQGYPLEDIGSILYSNK